jgi:hypothetical protein
LVTGYGKRKADMEGGSKKQVCKKLKPIHVCAFSLYSSFGFRFCTYSEVMLLSSFGFGYKIIWRKRGVLRIKGKRGVAVEIGFSPQPFTLAAEADGEPTEIQGVGYLGDSGVDSSGMRTQLASPAESGISS